MTDRFVTLCREKETFYSIVLCKGTAWLYKTLISHRYVKCNVSGKDLFSATDAKKLENYMYFIYLY
jgi:hypothetical protein